MARLSQQEIKDRNQRFQKLPQPLQDAMFSMNVAENIHGVAQKNNLSAGITILAETIGEVFLGMLHPNLLIRALADRAKIPVEQARTIALDVSGKIFAPVRNELLAMYKIDQQPTNQRPTTNDQRLTTAPTTAPSALAQRIAPLSEKTMPTPRVPQPLQPPIAPPRPTPSQVIAPPQSGGLPPRPAPPRAIAPQRSAFSPPNPPPQRPVVPQPSPPLPVVQGNTVNLKRSTNNESPNL